MGGHAVVPVVILLSGTLFYLIGEYANLKLEELQDIYMGRALRLHKWSTSARERTYWKRRDIVQKAKFGAGSNEYICGAALTMIFGCWILVLQSQTSYENIRFLIARNSSQV